MQTWMTQQTKGHKCVVEMGSMLFTRLAQVDPGVSRRIGIEIWEPYIENAKFHDCEKIHGDMREFDTLLPEDARDCVMFIDTLEHLVKDEALDVLERCKARFQKILIFAPEGKCVQEEDVTGYGAHEAQTHRSSWTKAELEHLDFEVIEDPDYHGALGGALFATWVAPTEGYDYRGVYTQVFRQNPKYNRQGGEELQYSHFVRYLDEHRDSIGSVMELGTGRGAVIRMMRNHLDPSTDLIGIDLECYIRPELQGGVQFIRCDMTNPEERKAVQMDGMDVVACIGVLEHICAEDIEDVVSWIGEMQPTLGFVFMTADHSDVKSGHELHVLRKGQDFWDDIFGRNFIITDQSTITIGPNDVFSYTCTRKG